MIRKKSRRMGLAGEFQNMNIFDFIIKESIPNELRPPVKRIEFPKEFHLADIVDFFIKGTISNELAPPFTGYSVVHRVNYNAQNESFYFDLQVPLPERIQELKSFDSKILIDWDWRQSVNKKIKTKNLIMIDNIYIKKNEKNIYIDLEFVKEKNIKHKFVSTKRQLFLIIKTKFALLNGGKELKDNRKYTQFISTIRNLIDSLDNPEHEDILNFLEHYAKILQTVFYSKSKKQAIQFNTDFLSYILQKYEQKPEVFKQFNPIFHFLWWIFVQDTNQDTNLDSSFDFEFVARKLTTLFTNIIDFKQIEGGEFVQRLKESILPHILTNKKDIDTFIDILSNLLRLRIYLESSEKMRAYRIFKKNNIELEIARQEMFLKFQSKRIGKADKLTSSYCFSIVGGQLLLLPEFSNNLIKIFIMSCFLLFFSKLEKDKNKVKKSIKYLVDKIILISF